MTFRPRKQALIGDRHALGHPEIDSDHFAISACWLQAICSEPIALPLHIARLRKLMRKHFENEAALVEAAGSSFCACHRREHDSMLQLCDSAYSQSDRNWRQAHMLLRGLPKLFRNHVIRMDQIAVLIIYTAAQNQTASSLPTR